MPSCLSLSWKGSRRHGDSSWAVSSISTVGGCGITCWKPATSWVNGSPNTSSGWTRKRPRKRSTRSGPMKPGRRDIRHKLLITGDELRELQRHVYAMVEAFGLDRKIEAYKGTRPLTLYRWDLDCLMDVIANELQDTTQYPDKNAPEYR